MPLKLHSIYDVCSFLRQAYVNSPDEEDLYDYLYEDGGIEKLLRQEEEDDIRKAVQERYHIDINLARLGFTWANLSVARSLSL